MEGIVRVTIKRKGSKTELWKCPQLDAKSRTSKEEREIVFGQVGGESKHCPRSKGKGKYWESRKGGHFQQWHMLWWNKKDKDQWFAIWDLSINFLRAYFQYLYGTGNQNAGTKQWLDSETTGINSIHLTNEQLYRMIPQCHVLVKYWGCTTNQDTCLKELRYLWENMCVAVW